MFPDGDLSVKPMTNFERGKGNWSPHTNVGSSSQARLSPRVIREAPTTPIRSSTPTRSFRARTPAKARASTDKEISASQSSVSSKPASGTPKQVRSRTPMRGRPSDHFDYDQKTKSNDEEVLRGIRSADREVDVKGPRRELGAIKKYP